MSFQSDNPFVAVAESAPQTRAAFIRKTYNHLAGAILAFIVVEYLMLQAGVGFAMLSFMQSFGSMGWLGILGGFMVASWFARSMATHSERNMQYVGLGIYVVAQALIFAPILHLAASYYEGVISSAATMTLLLFAGLTATVFITKKDFSFLRTILMVGGAIALGMIVCGALFGFQLGMWFSVGMIVFASAAILYDTSKVMHHYHESQYVGASLELFASVALLFWYILQLFMSRD
ncbi:MAG: Bax inhibitor-1 family protein [Verrucomicrobiota bacterium]